MGKKNSISKAKKVGLPPGALVYVGENPELQTEEIEVCSYSKDKAEFTKVKNPEQALQKIIPSQNTWININGLTNVQNIATFGNFAGILPLFVEDILNTQHRPKIEIQEKNLFLIVKMVYFQGEQLKIEHLAIILGENYLFSFQETSGDVFEALRKRFIMNFEINIREKSPDYLLFAMLDAIIDNYYTVMEKVSQRFEELEDTIIFKTNPGLIDEIQDFKKEIIQLRKAILPMREVITKLQKVQHKLIKEQTQNYMSDLHDHILQITENTEIYRDAAWGLMDTYMSAMSNRMNSVMQLLTVISVIFIPLTFIVGVYGMNFDNMPELHLKWGYHAAWVVMISVAVGMLFYFKKKKWL